MSLPKLSYPIFELNIPSLNREVKFRPFLVKEEKILLTAQTSGDPKDMVMSIKQVITNCLMDEEIDVDNLATFDLEYLFIKLRAKSINNVIEVFYTDPDDEERYKIEINLDEINIVSNPEHTNKIEISRQMGMVMKYPKIDIVNSIKRAEDETEVFFDIFKYSIDTIYEGEKVYNASEYSETDLDEFVQSLDVNTMKKVQEFFASMPKLHYVANYVTRDGVTKELVLNSLSDFFMLG